MRMKSTVPGIMIVLGLLFPAAGAAREQRRKAAVFAWKVLGKHRIPRRLVRSLRKRVGRSLHLLRRYRIRHHRGKCTALECARTTKVGKWADELWTGTISMVPKIYANGKVYHLTLYRTKSGGGEPQVADKYGEIHHNSVGKSWCQNPIMARRIYCGHNHLRYLTHWLVKRMLDNPKMIPPLSRGPVQLVKPDKEIAGMAYVPAGHFIMGGNFGEFDEMPRHSVYLDAYYIDKYEVTNGDYGKCVAARVCRPSRVRRSRKFKGAQRPVVAVSWHDAVKYCRWRGKRLPTEAEWEKAARGTDERRWPWGNTFDRRNVNLRSGVDGFKWTAPVGRFPRGASPYGVHDMAGNAWEWCHDWWAFDYYKKSPGRNPRGPAFSPRGRRVMRSGTWKYEVPFFTTTTNRSHTFPWKRSSYVGFRCAKSADSH